MLKIVDWYIYFGVTLKKKRNRDCIWEQQLWMLDNQTFSVLRKEHIRFNVHLNTLQQCVRILYEIKWISLWILIIYTFTQINAECFIFFYARGPARPHLSHTLKDGSDFDFPILYPSRNFGDFFREHVHVHVCIWEEWLCLRRKSLSWSQALWEYRWHEIKMSIFKWALRNRATNRSRNFQWNAMPNC